MDFAGEAFKMAGALATVVVLMMGGMVVLRRVLGEGLTTGGGAVMRLLGGLRLGPGKSIVLVEVADEVLVLGATSRELTLLARVDDPERVKRLRPTAGRSLPHLRMWPRGLWSRSPQGQHAVQNTVETT